MNKLSLLGVATSIAVCSAVLAPYDIQARTHVKLADPANETPCVPIPKCSDFKDQKAAQTILEGIEGDPFKLDANGDGIACLNEDRKVVSVLEVRCTDFNPQGKAQVILDTFPGDPFHLDPDGNGIACDNTTTVEPEVFNDFPAIK